MTMLLMRVERVGYGKRFSPVSGVWQNAHPNR